ncbi:hypothetical protein IWX58_003016 [Rubrivivax gelatinosus]|nr:hypothetical protein [Rubrivivax gelatinosus]
MATPKGARCTAQLIGRTDGRASARVADYLLGASSR